MASIASAKKMLINSTYPTDKIVTLKTGSFVMPSPVGGYVTTIPHGLGFTPLVGGNWSTVSDFSIQYEYSTGLYPSTNPGYVYDTIFNVYADNTNIYIDGDNVSGSKTIYYRVFGYEPSNSSALLPSIANQGDSYVINSTYNYPKLFLNNYADLPAGGSSDGFYYVDHFIGSIPQAAAWITYNTYNGSTMVSAVHPIGTTTSYSEGIALIVGTDRIAFLIPAFISAHRVFYKVWLDE